jgi:hypothetical protein
VVTIQGAVTGISVNLTWHYTVYTGSSDRNIREPDLTLYKQESVTGISVNLTFHYLQEAVTRISCNLTLYCTGSSDRNIRELYLTLYTVHTGGSDRSISELDLALYIKEAVTGISVNFTLHYIHTGGSDRSISELDLALYIKEAVTGISVNFLHDIHTGGSDRSVSEIDLALYIKEAVTGISVNFLHDIHTGGSDRSVSEIDLASEEVSAGGAPVFGISVNLTLFTGSSDRNIREPDPASEEVPAGGAPMSRPQLRHVLRVIVICVNIRKLKKLLKYDTGTRYRCRHRQTKKFQLLKYLHRLPGSSYRQIVLKLINVLELTFYRMFGCGFLFRFNTGMFHCTMLRLIIRIPVHLSTSQSHTYLHEQNG